MSIGSVKGEGAMAEDKKCPAVWGIKSGTGQGLIFGPGVVFVHKIRNRASYATILGLWERRRSAKIKTSAGEGKLLCC